MNKGSKLKFHQKSKIHSHYILELLIWEINNTARYPDNIKYRLVFTDNRNNRKVLFDNHFPKKHHYHIDNQEYDYDFSDEDKLIEDFKQSVYNIFGVKI